MRHLTRSYLDLALIMKIAIPAIIDIIERNASFVGSIFTNNRKKLSAIGETNIIPPNNIKIIPNAIISSLSLITTSILYYLLKVVPMSPEEKDGLMERL